MRLARLHAHNINTITYRWNGPGEVTRQGAVGNTLQASTVSVGSLGKMSCGTAPCTGNNLPTIPMYVERVTKALPIWCRRPSSKGLGLWPRVAVLCVRLLARFFRSKQVLLCLSRRSSREGVGRTAITCNASCDANVDFEVEHILL